MGEVSDAAPMNVSTSPLRACLTTGPGHRRWAPVAFAALFALAAILGSLVAMQVANGTIPYPSCGLKRLTGLPCPGCGGTRSVAALAHLNWQRALQLNPLAVLLVLGAFLSVPVSAIDVWLNKGRATRTLGESVGTRRFNWTITALVAVNWIYLLCTMT